MSDGYKVSIAAARVNADLTQRKAASLLGINVATLQNYESGKTSPNWDMINKMVELYKVPVNLLNLHRS